MGGNHVSRASLKRDISSLMTSTSFTGRQSALTMALGLDWLDVRMLTGPATAAAAADQIIAIIAPALRRRQRILHLRAAQCVRATCVASASHAEAVERARA